MKYDIFISYRRDGGDTLAQLIYDRLTHRGYRVFLDIESLNAGKFNEKLLDVIEECKDIVVVLPPKALDRCHNEGDWLYREIDHGIKLSKNIIPVLMKDFVWPDEIPAAISEIKNYNGILDNKDYFDAVIDKITSMLKSKPVLGGNFTLKFQHQKHSLKSTLKRRKKVFLTFILLLLIGVGTIGFFQHKKIQEQIRNESYVSIELTPAEEMSASEYYNAIDILKERIDIFAEGYDYTFKEEKDKINISFPMEVYHDIDPLNITRSTITRPGELYLAPATYDGDDLFLHIERSSIENIELVSEVPVEFDFTNYAMKGSEEYQYFALTLDSNTAQAVNEWLNKTNALDYHLFLDYEDFGYSNSFYSLMKMDADTNIIYFIGDCQYENMLNTVLYNFTHDTFSHAFSVILKQPVKWENIQNAKYIVGSNQCNEEDLEGPLIRLDYKSYQKDFTDGEYQDTIITLKSRLDLLNTPYAFGYYANDKHTISIKLAPSHLNDQIIELLGLKGTHSFSIASKFYEIVSSYYLSSAEDVEIIETGSDTYALQIMPNTYWQDYLSKEEWSNILNDSSAIYLCYDKIPLCETTLAETYNGKTFTFDNLSYFELDTIDEEHKYLLELFKAVISGSDMPYLYSCENVYYENITETDDTATLFPLNEKLSKEVKKSLETVVSELSEITDFKVNVSELGQSVSINLELPINDTFAENIAQILQELYTKGNFESGDHNTIIINFMESLDKNNYYFRTVFNVSLSKHKVETSFYGKSLSTEEAEKLESQLNSNPFYRELTIDEYMLDENGNILLHH